MIKLNKFPRIELFFVERLVLGFHNRVRYLKNEDRHLKVFFLTHTDNNV